MPQSDDASVVPDIPKTDPCYRFKFEGMDKHEFYSPGFEDKPNYTNNTNCVRVLEVQVFGFATTIVRCKGKFVKFYEVQAKQKCNIYVRFNRSKLDRNLCYLNAAVSLLKIHKSPKTILSGDLDGFEKPVVLFIAMSGLPMACAKQCPPKTSLTPIIGSQIVETHIRGGLNYFALGWSPPLPQRERKETRTEGGSSTNKVHHTSFEIYTIREGEKVVSLEMWVDKSSNCNLGKFSSSTEEDSAFEKLRDPPKNRKAVWDETENMECDVSVFVLPCMKFEPQNVRKLIKMFSLLQDQLWQVFKFDGSGWIRNRSYIASGSVRTSLRAHNCCTTGVVATKARRLFTPKTSFRDKARQSNLQVAVRPCQIKSSDAVGSGSELQTRTIISN
ncbi:hypothetical protein GEV33_013084 [Tenebrio molitor]|uniref:Uncharacterized protein n=1 Tax=Tenebrio molitor TaxID=7067 RepID=A0A8J6L8A4_TENMO|nr:hypothetical protein GEV33_013084 [Tenebrio molitor]